jgi:hypothetical protein
VRGGDHAQKRGKEQSVHERLFRDRGVKISCAHVCELAPNGTMARMSTSYIGSDALTSPVTPLTIPGFDVLNPTSYAETSSGSTANALASTSNTASSTTPTASSTSSTASTSTTGQNPYQQAVATLEQWQYQALTQSLTGNTSDATSALYASAGLNADQFAQLATELQNLGSTPAAGSTVDTTA